MYVFIRFFILVFFGLMIQGCACSYFFEFDNGASWKNKSALTRFGDIKEKEFVIGIKIHSESIDITPLTHFNAPLLVKDSVNKVRFIKFTPSFSEGIVLEKKTRYNSHFKTNEDYYTCDNFSELIKKNKNLNLKVIYDLDSLGVITNHEKEYKLVKKQYCRVAVH